MKKGILTTGIAATLIGGSIAGTSAFASSGSQDDAKEAAITEEEAINTALEEVPGKAIETDLDDEDGETVYEVDVKGEDGKMWDLDINAQNGDVLQKHADDDEGRDEDEDDGDDELSDKEEQKQLKKEAAITAEKSQSIALKEVKGDVIDNELDKEDGTVVYSLEIRDDQGTEHDVDVDAKTGDVLKMEKDDDSDDDEEDDD
ncbi:hypothetical protein GCM10028778_22880 [Barrientosiimonas marina]|uniref:PepSY domain-containing protein n=1 Tax=Lentibacillus kimchii TaxID=1542911 RepID=A0ABW2UWZ0_9BACI